MQKGISNSTYKEMVLVISWGYYYSRTWKGNFNKPRITPTTSRKTSDNFLWT